jgi:glycosyltransferase involved in cell wall biosynthesis
MPDTPQHVPLLTIAIPTYNRAEHLASLLALLESQLATLPQVDANVELLVSDNASTDRTPEVIRDAQLRFASTGARLTTHRHPTNIGADANFVSCYRRARGHFLWICGDDDLIVPGAVAELISHLQNPDGSPADIDLIYATSYGFRSDPVAEWQADPFRRRFHTIRDPRHFAMVVNIMFTFISGIIVNKARLESLPHEAPEAFLDTNLVQLSWSLPLLLHHRKSIVLWERPVAARIGNAHGYALGEVFGEQLASTVSRLLPNRPDLSAPILNFALRRWLPSVVIDVRTSANQNLGLHDATRALRSAYSSNPRFWIFTWPALTLPLPLAKLYTRATAALCKLIYIAHLPGFWRKQTD